MQNNKSVSVGTQSILIDYWQFRTEYWFFFAKPELNKIKMFYSCFSLNLFQLPGGWFAIV